MLSIIKTFAPEKDFNAAISTNTVDFTFLFFSFSLRITDWSANAKLLLRIGTNELNISSPDFGKAQLLSTQTLSG